MGISDYYQQGDRDTGRHWEDGLQEEPCSAGSGGLDQSQPKALMPSWKADSIRLFRKNFGSVRPPERGRSPCTRTTCSIPTPTAGRSMCGSASTTRRTRTGVSGPGEGLRRQGGRFAEQVVALAQEWFGLERGEQLTGRRQLSRGLSRAPEQQ